MNKELILKYKDEFDYWVKGGKILMHYGKWVPVSLDAKWEFFMSDLEKMGSFGYVINDEYVEFRKALAEGKTIQYSPDNCETWSDLDSNTKINFRWPLQNYRIKPEEPQFKVGDWCTHPNANSPFQWCKNDTDTKNISLWKPNVGEYCWFWNDGQAIPNLREFESFRGRYQVKDIGLLSDFYGYAYCEPFINDLPTKLKVE